MIATLGLAVLAGVLSVLSPCVLPLLPIVLGTAQSEHRLGPMALAAGLAASFTAIGLFVATVGFAIGLDTDAFRLVSAGLLIAVGVVLLVPRLQEQFAVAAGPMAPGSTTVSAASRRRAYGASSVWASCSARSGRHASDRHSAPRPFSPPRARTSARWR